MTNTIKHWLVLVPIAVFFAGLIVVSLAHAQGMPDGNNGIGVGVGLNAHINVGGGQGDNNSSDSGEHEGRSGFRGFPGAGVAGKVTAISGTTISIQSIGMEMKMMHDDDNASGTTTRMTMYSVDASNATVRKDNATSTVSAIAVGDMIFARGTVNGASVMATSIIDGMMMGRGMGQGGFRGDVSGDSSSTINGTIAAINGSSLTVTGDNGTSYTVDTTNAVLLKQGNATNSISAINVGDSVHIQGVISGSSVMANVVLDNVSTAQAGKSSNPNIFFKIMGFLGGLLHFKF